MCFTTTALSFISLLISTNEQLCVNVVALAPGIQPTVVHLFYTVLFERLQVLVSV